MMKVFLLFLGTVTSHVLARATMRVQRSLDKKPYSFVARAPSPSTVAALPTMTKIPVPSASAERTCFL